MTAAPTATPTAAIDGDAERERWTASAALWDRWADPMAELADKLNQPLLDAAGVAPGSFVLDLACGIGEPALSAARRAGARGFVVGADLIPAMLTGAMRRAAALETPPAFAGADMTALPFPDATFDAVTCRFGIMFVPDAAGALEQARRVLKPGGRMALMVWGARADNTLFAVIGRAVEDRFGPRSAHSLNALFRYAEPGSLSAALHHAGFTRSTETALTPTRRAPRAQPFWRPTLDMVFGPQIAGLSPDDRAALELDIISRFNALAQGDTAPLSTHVRIVVGVV